MTIVALMICSEINKTGGLKGHLSCCCMVRKIFILIAMIMVISFLHGSLWAASTNSVAVTATVLSKNQCKFSTATAALNFGNLDPANPVDKTVSTSVNFRCMGSSPTATFFINDDDGLYESDANTNRMRHTSVGTEYIPYSFTLDPTSGTIPKNTPQTLTISGTVNGTDYQDAATGTYADTVVITVEP
jgi:spore coat protein U-like protein